jgi:protein O-mannosyl-transferase
MSRRNRAPRNRDAPRNQKRSPNAVGIEKSQCVPSSAVWISVALSAAIFLVYAPVRNFGFVDFDDDFYVSLNQHVQQGLTWAGVKWAFTSVSLYYWQPFTWLSHMIDCQVFGLNPGAFHLVNVAIHAANTVLVFLVFRTLTRRLWPSAIVAGLFALHPLRVESVAWIAERKDVLSAFFGLLTVWMYVLYARRKNLMGYILAVAAFACALMSKPTVVNLPIALLALDFWPLARFRFGERFPLRLVVEKLPLLGMAAMVSLLTVVGQTRMGASPNLGLWTRFETAASGYVSYLGMLLWPKNLAVMYPYSMTYSIAWILLCILLLILLTVAAVYVAKQYPFLCFGWFWYLLMLLPMSGLIRQAGPQALADRFTYLPSIGLFVAAVWFAAEKLSYWRNGKLIATVSVTLILSTLGVASAEHLTVWRDSATLFGNAVAVAPGSAISQDNLAYGLAEQGRYAEAIPHYRRALQLDPNFFRAHYHLGRALYEQGQIADAAAQFEKVLQHPLAPDYESDVRNALGIALIREGNVVQAKLEFVRALQLKPDAAELHANLGSCFATEGDLKHAVIEFRDAARIKPDYAEAHRNLGIALSQLGQSAEALAELETALRLSPGDLRTEHLIQTLRPKNKP